VEEERVYLSYGRVGATILDVSNPERQLLVMNSEAILEGFEEPLDYALVVDIADEMAPRIIGWLPRPRPSDGSGYRSYQQKGGCFGPHNQAHHQRQRVFKRLRNTVLLTYFNAGLRVFDIKDPFNPLEIGYFVSADPEERLGPMSFSRLVTQTEDVVIDSRGYIYCTDKNQGLFVLRYEGELT
jgi:hypothetical protein